MIFKRLIQQYKVAPFTLLIGILTSLIAVFGVQAAPLIVQNILDNILSPISQTGRLNTGQLVTQSALYVGLVTVSTFLQYIALICVMSSSNRIVEHLRNEAYRKMQHLPIAYFDDKPAGKISSRIVNDTEQIRGQFYIKLVAHILLHLVYITVIYGILFYINVWVALVLILLIPLFYLWQKLYQHHIKEPMADYYEARSEVNSQVNEVMNGSVILQLFQQESAFEERFDTVSKTVCDNENTLLKVESILSWSLMELFKRLCVGIVLAFIGYQFLGNAGFSVGAIFTLVNYIEQLFNSIGVLVREMPNIQRSLATGARIFELLDEVSEEDKEAVICVSEGNVSFHDVSFGYTEDKQVLHHITLHAKKGETIALVGHTGSGKSSIINLLFRFYDPQQGYIMIDGQKITDFSRESIRQSMGIVLQDPYLFTGTIKENITMHNEDITDDMVLDALEKVGAKDMLDKLPLGIYSPVVEKGNAFSSGEKQLLSFARTLASNPKILILDEATSHIDTETEEIIQQAMKVVKEGRTTFIVAHRLSTIQDADHILVLDKGEIIERGNHKTLLAQQGVYAQLYKTQQKIKA